MDMSYKLTLRWSTENKEQVDSVLNALDQIKMKGADVSVTMGKVGTTGGVGLNSMVSSLMRVGFMFNMYESAMMRAEMAQMMLTASQDRYNDAISKYGRNSEQAIRAAKQLQVEMRYLDNANLRANVSMGLLTATMVVQSGVLEAKTWKTVIDTGATVVNTIATWANNAAKSVSAVLMNILSGGTLTPSMVAAAAAGTAIVAGAGIVGYSLGSRGNNDININAPITIDGNIDDALREQNRRVKSEYGRMRP